MKYKTMKEIEERKAQILKEMEQEGADLDALKSEMDELRQNADAIREAAAKAEETRKAIASGAAGIVIGETRKAETAAKTLDEIRGSKAYVDAFARYLQTEDDRECRALLSENASSGGQVPVPTLVDPIIKTEWEKSEILSKVKEEGISHRSCQVSVRPDPRRSDAGGASGQHVRCGLSARCCCRRYPHPWGR